jgi:hypothetical protein
VYRKSFDITPATLAQKGRHVWLDLGAVADLATVKVNGRDLGTRWIAPWQFDLTAALRPGSNELEIEVINPWNNRLVGDAALPAGQRRTSLSLTTVRANAPLRSAGLLGPVTLRLAESATPVRGSP